MGEKTPRLVKAGDPILASDWNAMQRALAPTLSSQRPGAGFGSSSPTIVSVKNLTGVDVDGYTCWYLGGPRWTFDGPQSQEKVVFELLGAPSTSRPNQVAIVQQPLLQNGTGKAVILGPSVVKVTGDGATQYSLGSPNSSGVIVPGSGSAVTLLSARPTGGGYMLCNVNDFISTLPCTWIWARNDGGPTIKRFDCVTYYGSTPYTGSQLDATRPTDLDFVTRCTRSGGSIAGGASLGIMLDDTPYNKYGRMAVAGVTFAKIRYQGSTGFSGVVEAIADSYGYLYENGFDSATFIFRAITLSRGTLITDELGTQYGLNLINLTPQKVNSSTSTSWTMRAPEAGIAAPTVVTGTPGSGSWTFASGVCKYVNFTSGSTWTEQASGATVYNIGPSAVPGSALIEVHLQGSRLVTKYWSSGGVVLEP